MTRRSQILVLIASLALAATYAAPLWRIDLTAPQYPEGLGMRIWSNTITGVGEWDLKKVNQLNHYIGMKAIEPDSIRELDLMPWLVGLLMLTGLGTVAIGRRWALYGWVVLFGALAVAGFIDFYLWEYDYGHDLNPMAPIKVPGLSYQPPLIGSKQIMNFTARSWPAVGGWIAIAAFGLASLALLLELFRRRTGMRPSAAAAGAATPGRSAGTAPAAGSFALPLVFTAAVGALTASCSPGPRPIAYGEDQGEYCRMAITDERYGAELVTRRGRVHMFDSVECLAGFLLEYPDPQDVHSLWVTDFSNPPTLIRVEDAFFLRSRDLNSPMGAHLTAFGSGITRDAVRNSFYGEILSWEQVLGQARDSRAQAAYRDDSPSSRAVGVAAHAHAAAAGDDVLRVAADGPYRTITAAIEAAEPGARIVVEPGVYREPTIAVDKPLEISGIGEAVLDGEGARQIMTVTADDVVIRGLTFRNVGTSYVEDRAAIRVEQARRCRIEQNRFDEAFFGIYLASVADCLVADNDLRATGERETASGNGIHAWYSKDVVIRGNHIAGHRDGIYFEFVEDARVEDNTSEGNLRYGLHFMFSNGCNYVGNVFARNGAGVAVMYTKRVEMRGNLFDRNWGTAAFGLLLKDITDSRIEGNAFRGNSVGLWAEGSNRVRVEQNVFEANGWAVKIMSNSVDSEFNGNDFVGNTFDVATNSRHSYSRFIGNYWDNYRGYDLDGDGVGDVPFRPVRLFSLIVERNEPSLVLLRSLLVSALDAAERVLPAITPETLADEHPMMRPSASPSLAARVGLDGESGVGHAGFTHTRVP